MQFSKRFSFALWYFGAIFNSLCPTALLCLYDFSSVQYLFAVTSFLWWRLYFNYALHCELKIIQQQQQNCRMQQRKAIESRCASTDSLSSHKFPWRFFARRRWRCSSHMIVQCFSLFYLFSSYSVSPCRSLCCFSRFFLLLVCHIYLNPLSVSILTSEFICDSSHRHKLYAPVVVYTLCFFVDSLSQPTNLNMPHNIFHYRLLQICSI